MLRLVSNGLLGVECAFPKELDGAKLSGGGDVWWRRIDMYVTDGTQWVVETSDGHVTRERLKEPLGPVTDEQQYTTLCIEHNLPLQMATDARLESSKPQP